MVWTLHIITICMALTSDVSTMSIRRIKRENNLRNQISHDMPKFSSEELSKPLKYIDSANVSNTTGHLESPPFQNKVQMLYFEHINKTKHNDNKALRRTIDQIPATHHGDQNLALRKEYNVTEASNMHQISKVDVPKSIENYKNKSTEKLKDVQGEGVRLLRTKGQAVITQPSDLFKSIDLSIENQGTKIENCTTGGSSNLHGKLNENKGFLKLNPKMKLTGSEYIRQETSTGVKIFPLHNDNFNQRKNFQFSFLDYVTKRKEPTFLINSSRNYTNSKSNLISTKGVFPEEHFSLDVLTSVQREDLHGFPKGKNQLFNTNIELQTTTEEVYKWSDENHFATKKSTEPTLMFVDEIKEARGTQEHLKKNNVTKTNSDLNLPMPGEEMSNGDIESQTTTYGKEYVQNGDNSYGKSTEPTVIFVDYTTKAQAILENGKSSNITEKFTLSNKLESEHKELKKLTNQKKEDEIQVKNAMYKFSTSQNDGISDLLHERTETRQDGIVTGSYTYSDGFLLRKVNYVADKNGYRIISEMAMPLAGNGPKVNPEGIADIRTDVGGHPLHYVVHGREISTGTFHRQGTKLNNKVPGPTPTPEKRE